jgi:hypothetical protein
MSLRLKRFLFNQYNGFADKRIKDISKDYAFKVDDQSSIDVHDQFCGIFVRVIADNRFMLSVTNNAPINRSIRVLLKPKKAKISTIENRSSFEIELSVMDIDFIRDLSKEIADLVFPGKKYKDRNWKWLCPRTAGSLKLLADILSKYKETH